jgi:UDP-N-acetylmuramoyl-tripeptide--D-alanyl-D-alanine ligase
MNRFVSMYTWRYPRTLIYMLQASEYNLTEYFEWFWRVKDFRTVEHRKSLDPTVKARLLLLLSRIAFAIGYSIWLSSAVIATIYHFLPLGIFAFIWSVVLPYGLAFGIVLPLYIGRKIIQEPKERRMILEAQIILAKHNAIKIGIAGSYGKTTMKEILATVLSAGYSAGEVKATPGNMNTPIGVSRFVKKLDGNEKVLIFEMGEYYPGDIKTLSELVQPSIGVITGINEAHLSKFKTLDRTVATIFELDDYLEGKNVYKNGDNSLVADRSGHDPLIYSIHGTDGWMQTDLKHANLNGLEFTLTKGKNKLKVKTQLLGTHQVGPLSAAVAIAIDKLGLTSTQVEEGIKNIVPFEHRMEQKALSSGAILIDDAYNGNADGLAAGIRFLEAQGHKESRSRYYLTPGLVEAGDRTEAVHRSIGKQLAATKIEHILLIKNSVTPFIAAELDQAGLSDRVRWFADMPAALVALPQMTVAGDIVLLQNDWSDNYA